MLIKTKFLPCTETKPNRVKAKSKFDSITLSWDDSMPVLGNHEQAAYRLLEKLEKGLVRIGPADGMLRSEPDESSGTYIHIYG